jgi:hypothetical protein
MSIVHYAIAGATAFVAALSGVLVQVSISQPDTPSAEQTVEAGFDGGGEKFSPITVPVFSKVRKIGYCVLRVDYDNANSSSDEWRIALPRVTNELYVEFATVMKDTADGATECVQRVGTRTKRFVIYEAEFYEQLQ